MDLIENEDLSRSRSSSSSIDMAIEIPFQVTARSRTCSAPDDQAESVMDNQSETGSGSVIEVQHVRRPARYEPLSLGDGDEEDEEGEEGEDEDDIEPLPGQKEVKIHVPTILEEEAAEFEFLPGHDRVRKVQQFFSDGTYAVQMITGETIQIDDEQILELENGAAALQVFDTVTAGLGVSSPKSRELIDISDGKSDGSNSSERYAQKDFVVPDDFDSEEEVGRNRRQPGRQSARLAVQPKRKYGELNLADNDSLDGTVRRSQRTTQSSRGTNRRLSRRSVLQLSNSEDEFAEDSGKRRSERTRVRPRANMVEKNEDEISSRSDREQATVKVIGTKEYFARMPEDDLFRQRHRQECDTCSLHGDLFDKGPLVFCQGCTNSYHRLCLGPRGSRDHLVTKVGDKLFILQCRRCIGTARSKDRAAPHQGHCAGCDEGGLLSSPLRERWTTKQEQIRRERNSGIDPVTPVHPNLVDQIRNVMFRCVTCQRAWHMHHLPKREVVHEAVDDEENEELMSDEVLAQHRFDHYRRSWRCKDCLEHQNAVDTMVAWRPVNLDAYVPGTRVDMLPESKKEYLVKWKNQSHLHCSWMAGTWTWGVAAAPSRAAFNKRPENQLPKMTTEDAIPEDFFRVDIVFDVHYTSIVRNSSKEIDLARAKEVKEAYVKYKGLGYEDAIWEKPPHYTQTERWEDFKDAYSDFVTRRYMAIPPQSSLRRRLLDVRAQDFETSLIKKVQPSIMTGGEMMQYQMEGHNWLYYQWFRSHNAILADEMGLGKTIQIISFFATLIQDHKCWPFLVVVPNSTCPNWRREIKRWVPSIRAVTYYGSAAARKITQDFELFPKDKENAEQQKSSFGKRQRSEPKDIKAHIVIVSYESVSDEKTRQSLMRVPWQGLVVDEGQRLKNDKNLVYDSLSKFRFPYKVLLTGTPLQNNARELFNLLQFLDREKHNAADLEVKYADLTEENVSELHDLLKPYFLRRTKVQVLTFLPPMAQIILPVSMATLQKKVYKSILAQNPELMKSIFSRDGATNQKERANLNNILMQLRKTLCHPYVYNRDIEDRTLDAESSFRTMVEASAKLRLLSLVLPKLKERGHRVLIFSQFLDNLDIVEDFLDGLGLMHHRLDGTINALDKQKRIDDFNAADSPYFAFLLSTRAGGVGINLATADTVIILDPDFNPHQDIQALSRAHRIGQKNKVLVFQLMTRGSAEEKIMQIGKKKMALDHVLIEAMDREQDAGLDLESILKYGAEALFADDVDDDIVYDDASVDKLLDRSQVESTKTDENQSAESQFSFARIWANDKGSLEEGLRDSGPDGPANPGLWDKILQERERAYREEALRKAEQLGRGKRRRLNVDYGLEEADQDQAGGGAVLNANRARSKDAEDEEDFHESEAEPSDEDDEDDAEDAVSTSGNVVDEAEAKSLNERHTIWGRPFERVEVPKGPVPYYNQNGTARFSLNGQVPKGHHCSACREYHPMGWCRLKLAGVEFCGLCGSAHIGRGRMCPHLNDEQRVETMIATLKESTESTELIEQASKYLRTVRSDLIAQQRWKEKQRLAQQQQQSQQQVTTGQHNTTNPTRGQPRPPPPPSPNSANRMRTTTTADPSRTTTERQTFGPQR